jgi:ubiquitin-like-conjugating enzyme ATG3
MEFTGIEMIVEDGEGEDGWVTHETDENEMNMNSGEMTLDDCKLDAMRAKEEVGTNENDDGDEQEALDMEEFDVENVDPSVAIRPTACQLQKDSAEGDDSVVHTRTYDIHILYNKYYQTPHLFLIGYDEKRKLLNIDQMYEDVSQDNAKKTVTYEAHPHLGPSMLAVHPCRHSDLMKKFIQIVSLKTISTVSECVRHFLLLLSGRRWR